ncbi:uncharacterized protein LOC114728390 isoform X2 [Neltuma alba]|uniref:uncharacterized protein LOC114728390 isoform X2 n=1 Tax=Neltuma alba TaxID=207710 RepID=UPI0010A4B956|nr:uncharacterized protein LOC114728390 isoform X2 [Prosopis alba]
MSEEKDAFYLVRKGDVVGIYKSLSDIQVLLASSVGSLEIYKGYSLSKKAEEHLASHGVRGAAYSISAADVSEGLFGRIVACPYQQPYHSGGKSFGINLPSKVLRGADQPDNNVVGSSLSSSNSEKHQIFNAAQSDMLACLSCIIEFDGAAKGNPGPAGAGAVLRSEDGSKVCHLREGVGLATNNAAEYRGLILGLKHAIKRGYKHIRVQGDSLLVCNQMKGSWKTKNANMAFLCNEAKELTNNFLSFQINHVLREYNSEADVQANLAVNLRAGQVDEDCQC